MPFQIVRNDITKMHVDAIVNPASREPGFGAGTDLAVYRAAGKHKLLTKRREIGEIKYGDAAITEGYDLPAKYIIHTVGTAWLDGTHGEEEILRNCYRSVFRVAAENGIESLAFPLLASGSYGFPKGISLRIAISEIERFLDNGDMEIYLVVFDEKSFSLSSELYGDIDSYISGNYVAEIQEEEYAPSAPQRFSDHFFKKGDPAGHMFFAARSCRDSNEAFMGTASAPFETSAVCDEEAPCDFAAADQTPISAASMAQSRSLDDVVSNLDKTFMELVFSFADAKGMTDVEVQKKANIERKAFSKLKCGTTKNPSKSTALALAVALQLNLDETKDLLSRAGLALSPCSKQDVIVQYFIEREAYNIFEINIALFEHGEPPIGSQIE